VVTDFVNQKTNSEVGRDRKHRRTPERKPHLPGEAGQELLISEPKGSASDPLAFEYGYLD